MSLSIEQSGAGRSEAPFTGASTGPVQIGRFVLDVEHAGGTVLSVAGRRRQPDPPADLTNALGQSEKRDLAARADDLVDQLAAVTDKTDRVAEPIRAVLEGRVLDPKVIAGILESVPECLRRLNEAGRFAEIVRIARPVCRLLALTLRWAALVESLRIVLHAATALADSRTLGWSLHELGTLHQSVGHDEAARRVLNEARAIRERIGDAQGLAVTNQNLGLLSKPPMPTPRRAVLMAGGGLVVAALVLGLATEVGGGLSDNWVAGPRTSSAGRVPSNSPPTARGPSATPPPAGNPSPSAPSPVAPSFAITPSVVDFGTRTLKRTSDSRAVTLSNNGNALLVVAALRSPARTPATSRPAAAANRRTWRLMARAPSRWRSRRAIPELAVQRSSSARRTVRRSRR